MFNLNSSNSIMVDFELRVYLCIIYLFPRIRGWGRLKNLLIKIYNRKPRVKIITKILDFIMELDPTEHVDSEILFTKTYEQLYFDFMKCEINDRDEYVFIDCGANTGYYSLLMSSLTKSKAKVLSIEACPINFQRLVTNIELNTYSNIVPINIGLSDQIEVLSLNRNEQNKGMNTFFNHNNCNDSVLVKCKPLLHLLIDNNINKCNLLKIDIEGYEIKVLKEFFNTAPYYLRPEYIFIEENSDYLHKYEINIRELLTENNYQLVKSDNNNSIYVLFTGNAS